MSRVKENPRHRLHNEDPSAESESLVRSPSILGRWFDGSSSVGAANNNYSLVGASEAKKREKRARESESLREREREPARESERASQPANQPASERRSCLPVWLLACLLALRLASSSEIGRCRHALYLHLPTSRISVRPTTSDLRTLVR